MPVMFEEIDAEIAEERGHAPEAPPAKPAKQPQLADLLRRELALIKARFGRLVAD